MSKILVRHEVGLGHLPTLKKQQKAQLGTLENQCEDEIDHRDIASLTDAFWQSAEPVGFYKPT